MGFYSANTPEQKRVKQLTGDININDMFKNECNDRLMELLEERGKNKVTHRYVDFVSREDSASKGVIPKRGDETSALPPKDQIKIPPRARDGQTFKTDNELSQEEMLKKIMLQNKKIINQNKIIIDLLKKQGENND